MKRSAMAALLAALPLPALAAPAPAVPRQLDEAQAAGYRTVFSAIREQRWADAKLALAAMPVGPLHALARAELLTAKGSPRAEAFELTEVLTTAPELPQAEQLARMAKSRGVVELPPLPSAQRLIWTAGAPVRARAKATQADAVAAQLAVQMQPLIKEDRAEDAQALLDGTAGQLTPEALTEWRQRVAFIYYANGNDAAARTLATQAADGAGEWAVQARWLSGLAAWRQRDYAAAGVAFDGVAARSNDIELRAAGLYWAARADLAGAHPERVAARLTNAAQFDETFYGLLARAALGLRDPKAAPDAPGAAAWQQLGQRPNARVAAALTEIDEDDLADEVLRQQARIGAPGEFSALIRLAADLDLPSTQLWLTNNVPTGFRAAQTTRYPAPAWTPQNGWRVDKALVYAHALQESRFRKAVTSPAGALGLMQIVPAAASDFTRDTGIAVDRTALARPAVNIAVGQVHLERLRDSAATGGLLPKVIASYNAGLVPVGAWNAASRDGGDPLLYIESIPYWETRGYVQVVLRNYWMYERFGGQASPSRGALAQGLWPRFPGLAGAGGVRLQTAVAPARLRPVTIALPTAPVLAASPILTIDGSVASSGAALLTGGSR